MGKLRSDNYYLLLLKLVKDNCINSPIFMGTVNRLINKIIGTTERGIDYSCIENDQTKNDLAPLKGMMLKFIDTRKYDGDIYEYDINKAYLYFLGTELPYGSPIDKKEYKYRTIKFQNKHFKCGTIFKGIQKQMIELLNVDDHNKKLIKILYVRLVGSFQKNKSKKGNYSKHTLYTTGTGIIAQTRNYMLKTFKEHGITSEDILSVNTDGCLLKKPMLVKISNKIGGGKLEGSGKNVTFLGKCVGFGAIWQNKKQIKFQRCSLLEEDYLKNGINLDPFNYGEKDICRDPSCNYDINFDKTGGEITKKEDLNGNDIIDHFEEKGKGKEII